MATMTSQRSAGGGYVQRSGPTGLYEILDLLLDKGLVVDVFVRVSLVGIELLTIDARIVIASVDTYLRFAEAVNRLDLGQSSDEGLPELVQDITSDGAQSKTRGILEGAKESLFGSGEDEDEDENESENGSSERSSGKRSSSQRSRSSSRSGSRSRSSSRGRQS
jgi:hypothetical protein